MESKTALIHLASKANVPEVTLNAQYPSEWMVANADNKPSLSLINSISSLEEARKVISHVLKDGTLDVLVFCEAIYLLVDTIREKPQEDWTSFGRTLGKKETEMSPINLVDLHRPSDLTPRARNLANEIPVDDASLLMLAFAPYRLNRVPDLGKDAVKTRIEKQAKLPPGILLYLDTLAQSHYLIQNRRYLTLIAATDMFLNHFPKNQYGPVRVSTIPSKYRDCAALTSFLHVYEFLTMTDPSELLDWIFIGSAGTEAMKIMHPGQEWHLSHSYFPYQVDLGIVYKSYYSSVINPTLFLFLHSVGSLLGSQRSINARNNCKVDITILQAILMNAKLMAYAFKSHTGLIKVFAKTLKSEETSQKTQLEGAGLATDGEAHPANTKGSSWYEYYTKSGFTETPDMKHFFNSKKKELKESRKDSVGAFVAFML